MITKKTAHADKIVTIERDTHRWGRDERKKKTKKAKRWKLDTGTRSSQCSPGGYKRAQPQVEVIQIAFSYITVQKLLSLRDYSYNKTANSRNVPSELT
jgi:hypothetical protein